jgi:hypothetical protein
VALSLVYVTPVGTRKRQYDSYLYSCGYSFTSLVCAPASVAVIRSTAKPVTPIITLRTDMLMLPLQHLLMNSN